MAKDNLRKILWVALFVWIIFVYASYLRQGIEVWERGGEVFFRIFLLLIFLLAATGLGRKILKGLKFEAGFCLESSLFSLGIGSGILIYLLVGLGLVGLFNKWAVNILLAGIFFFTYREIGEIVSGTKSRIRDLLSSRWSFLPTVLVFVLLIQFFFNLVGASVLPSSWDGLGQHLVLPREWIRWGRLTYVPYIAIGRWLEPLNIAVLYGMALLVRDAMLAKLIHFAFGILTGLGIYALGKRYLSSEIGFLAAAIFYAIPIISYESTTALIDLGFTFYAFLALYALINWTRSGGKGWLIMSATMSGLSLGSHNLGVLSMAILALGILLSGWPFGRKKLVMLAKSLPLFIGVGGLVGSFWYLRHFLITGESILDLWYIHWGGWYFGALFRRLLASIIGTSALAGSINLRPLIPYFLVPWKITMYPGQFHGLGSMGLILLTFLPFLIFTRIRRTTTVKFILYYSAIFLVVWAVSAPVSVPDKRYLVPLLPSLSILAAYVIAQLWSPSRLLRKALFTLLILTLVFQMLYQAPEGLTKIHQRMLVFAGLKSQEEYIMENEETYPVFKYVNESLPLDAKVFVVNDLRTFYCERDYVGTIMEGNQPLDYSSLTDGRELLPKLKEAGVTHVVINQYLWDRRFGKGKWPKLMSDLRDEYLEVIYDKYPFSVHKVYYRISDEMGEEH